MPWDAIYYGMKEEDHKINTLVKKCKWKLSLIAWDQDKCNLNEGKKKIFSMQWSQCADIFRSFEKFQTVKKRLVIM